MLCKTSHQDLPHTTPLRPPPPAPRVSDLQSILATPVHFHTRVEHLWTQVAQQSSHAATPLLVFSRLRLRTEQGLEGSSPTDPRALRVRTRHRDLPADPTLPRTSIKNFGTSGSPAECRILYYYPDSQAAFQTKGPSVPRLSTLNYYRASCYRPGLTRPSQEPVVAQVPGGSLSAQLGYFSAKQRDRGGATEKLLSGGTVGRHWTPLPAFSYSHLPSVVGERFLLIWGVMTLRPRNGSWAKTGHWF